MNRSNNYRLNNGYWPQNINWSGANNNWTGAASATVYPNVNTNTTWWNNNILPYDYSYANYNGYVNGNQYRYPRHPHHYPGNNNYHRYPRHHHNHRHPVLY
jgi:hypothetical protein